MRKKREHTPESDPHRVGDIERRHGVRSLQAIAVEMRRRHGIKMSPQAVYQCLARAEVKLRLALRHEARSTFGHGVSQ